MTADTPIRVFLAGKKTTTEWRFDTGVGLGRIVNEGDGAFLSEKFASLAAAKLYCESKLEGDPSSIYYVFRGDDIVDTVMDVEFHQALEKRARRAYAFWSAAAVFVVSVVLSLAAMPFETTMSHTAYVAGMTLLYVAILSVSGAGSIEGLIMMAIILLLSVLAGTALSG